MEGIQPRRVIQGVLAGWTGMTGLTFVAKRLGWTRVEVMEIEGSFFAELRSPRAARSHSRLATSSTACCSDGSMAAPVGMLLHTCGRV